MAIINQVVKGGGTTPTGTKQITSNGTHDVAAYEYADVQVPTTAPAHYIEKTVDQYGSLVNRSAIPIDLTGVSRLSSYVLYGAYQGSTALTQLPDFSQIQAVQGATPMNYTFDGCSNLTGVVDFGNLTNLQSNGMLAAFRGTKITGVIIKKLESLMGGLESCFDGCTQLITFKFESLKTLTGNGMRSTFKGCTSMQSIWFYALTNPGVNANWNDFLRSTTGVTVHFPMVVQSTMSSWGNVTNGFGGTNTTVLFDLVTSLTGADGNTYTRQEKDSTTTATAWVYNDTLYYTSGVSDNTAGVNEPSVSDAIYSDAACTQSVTTITALS